MKWQEASFSCSLVRFAGKAVFSHSYLPELTSYCVQPYHGSCSCYTNMLFTRYFQFTPFQAYRWEVRQFLWSYGWPRDLLWTNKCDQKCISVWGGSFDVTEASTSWVAASGRALSDPCWTGTVSKKNGVGLNHCEEGLLILQHSLASILMSVDFNLLNLCPPSIFSLVPSFSHISPLLPSSSSACFSLNPIICDERVVFFWVP